MYMYIYIYMYVYDILYLSKVKTVILLVSLKRNKSTELIVDLFYIKLI